MSDPHNKDTAAAENADVERNEAAATDSKDTPPHSSGDATPNQSTATKAKKQRPGKEPRKQKRRRGNGLSIFMALLLGFTVVWAGAGVYLLWLEMQTLRSDLTFTNQKVVDTADNVANVRSETASNIDDVRAEGETLATQMSSLDGTVQEAQAAMAAGVAEVQDKQKFLEESFVDLRDSLKRDTDAWIAAEAAYLVKIAVDRLNLERDVRTAISDRPGRTPPPPQRHRSGQRQGRTRRGQHARRRRRRRRGRREIRLAASAGRCDEGAQVTGGDQAQRRQRAAAAAADGTRLPPSEPAPETGSG